MLEARYRTARAHPLGRADAPAPVGAGLLIRPAAAEARFALRLRGPLGSAAGLPSTARSTPCRATRPAGSPASVPTSG